MYFCQITSILFGVSILNSLYFLVDFHIFYSFQCLLFEYKEMTKNNQLLFSSPENN